MKRIILLTICLCLLYSCNNKKRGLHPVTMKLQASKSMQYRQDSTVTVINHDDFETLPFMEMNAKIKNIRYIPCYSKEPVGDVFQLIVYENRIIALDAFKAEKIFIFDFSGKLIKVIDSKGGGPEEYHGLFDMSISRQDNLLVFNDRLTTEKLYFSLDGQFIKKIRSTHCGYFEIYNNKSVNQTDAAQSYSNNIADAYNLTVSAGDSIFYKGFPYYPLQLQAVNGKGLQYNYKNELLYVPTLSDTVYKITSDSTYSVKYAVKQRKSIWQKRHEYLTTQEYMNLIKQSNYSSLDSRFLETEHYAVYTADQGQSTEGYMARSVYWYDKRTGKPFNYWLFHIDTASNENKMPNFIPTPLTVYKNYYAGIVLSYTLEEIHALWKKNIITFENQELDNIFKNGMREDLEFVLILCELW